MRPADTSPEVWDMYFEGLRRLGPEGRLRRLGLMSDEVRRVAKSGIRLRHPTYSDEEVLWAHRRQLIGDELFKKAYPLAPVLEA